MESEGEAGLEKAEQNRVYSVQLKREAVESYLTGDYSLREICEMFKIRDKRQLRAWLKVYNSGGDFKRMSGGKPHEKHAQGHAGGTNPSSQGMP